jgi:hypothetical protein
MTTQASDRADRTVERRLELHRLDRCLDELEAAHERDQVTLSQDMARRLSRYVGGLVPGMSISEGMRRVFREQQRYLESGARDDTQAGVPDVWRPDLHRGQSAVLAPAPHWEWHSERSPAPLDEVGARSLTERIRAATRELCLLLLEAHNQRAWKALGYESWSTYVHEELGMSRSRSYELLDHARVIRALQAAAETSDIPEISPYAARQIKPCLDQVVTNIQDRLRNASAGATMTTLGIIESSVELQRRRIAGRRETETDEGAEPARPRRGALLALPARNETWAPAKRSERDDGLDLARLHEAVRCLATMPSPAHVAAAAPHDVGGLLTEVEQALRWLGELADELNQRPFAATLRA